MFTFDFLIPRKVGRLSGPMQIGIVIFLYLSTIVVGYMEYQSLGTFFGYPLSLSILFVPIYEEILFRGIVLENITKKISQPKAIIFVSILFGAWHAKNIFWLSPQQLTTQILYATLLISPIFCWITLQTKSIWPSVILHYLNNLLSSPYIWILFFR